MPEVVCQKCGNDGGWYRVVEVEGIGWVNADIEAADDGSIIGTHDDGRAQDVQYDRSFHTAWGCASCNNEQNSVEELVMIRAEDGEESEPDQTLWYQKNPIPGQLTFEGA